MAKYKTSVIETKAEDGTINAIPTAKIDYFGLLPVAMQDNRPRWFIVVNGKTLFDFRESWAKCLIRYTELAEDLTSYQDIL